MAINQALAGKGGGGEEESRRAADQKPALSRAAFQKNLLGFASPCPEAQKQTPLCKRPAGEACKAKQRAQRASEHGQRERRSPGKGHRLGRRVSFGCQPGLGVGWGAGRRGGVGGLGSCVRMISKPGLEENRRVAVP